MAMSDDLFDKAIQSAEAADEEYSANGTAKYYLKESANWLKLAKFARKQEERDAAE